MELNVPTPAIPCRLRKAGPITGDRRVIWNKDPTLSSGKTGEVVPITGQPVAKRGGGDALALSGVSRNTSVESYGPCGVRRRLGRLGRFSTLRRGGSRREGRGDGRANVLPDAPRRGALDRQGPEDLRVAN